MKSYTKNTQQQFTPLNRNSKNPGRTWIMPFVLKVSFMIALIFLAVTARIHFNEKTERLGREAVRIKAQLHRLELEKTNLRNRKEELSSWQHISSRIEAFHLALRPASPTQVKVLKLLDMEALRRRSRAEAQLLSSSREKGDFTPDAGMRSMTQR